MKKLNKIFVLFLISLFLNINIFGQEIVSQNVTFQTPITNANGYTIALYFPTNANYYFTNTQTAAQMQAVIDALPKDLGGKTLTFYIYGKITNSASLVFNRFRNGALNITGTAVTGPSSSQTSIITNSANTYVFYFSGIDASCPITIDSVRGETKSSSGGCPFWFEYCPGMNTVKNCMCWNGGTGSGVVAKNHSSVYVNQTGFAGGGGTGIYSGTGSRVVAFNNANVGGAIVANGHYVDTCGIIQRIDATAIGTTDNFQAGGGSMIITSAGKQLP